MLWTAEAVEDLKKLALEGKSASHISAALGVGSRNAVIGKASRIGIKLGGGERGPEHASRARVALDGQALLTPGLATTIMAPKLPACAPLVKPEEGRAAWALGEVEIGEMRRVRFEDIREFACRWPLGDPRSGEFTYCGLTPAKGQSYCAGHCRMAYRAPQPRPVCGSEGSAPSRVRGGFRDAGARCSGACLTLHLPNTQISPGASAPLSRRVDAD